MKLAQGVDTSSIVLTMHMSETCSLLQGTAFILYATLFMCSCPVRVATIATLFELPRRSFVLRVCVFWVRAGEGRHQLGRVESLDADIFQTHFDLPRRPALFTRLMHDWAAAAWTPRSLAAEYGECKFMASALRAGVACSWEPARLGISSDAIGQASAPVNAAQTFGCG